MRIYFKKGVEQEAREVVRWAVRGVERLVKFNRPVKLHVYQANRIVETEPGGRSFFGRCSLPADPSKPSVIEVAALAGEMRWDKATGRNVRCPSAPRFDVLSVLVFVVVHELVHHEWDCKGKTNHHEGRVDRRAYSLIRRMTEIEPAPMTRNGA